MDKIQVAGFAAVDEATKTRVLEIFEKGCKKFDRHFEDYKLNVHLKGLHAVGETKKTSAAPKEKYELHLRLHTPKKKFVASGVEWDLVKLAHTTVDAMQRELEHAQKK